MAEVTKKLGMSDEIKEIMLIDSINGDIEELTGLLVIADKGMSKALAQKLVRRWNSHPALLEACEEIQRIILQLSDDADSERAVPKIQDYDLGYSEGKFRGIEAVEAKIGKILIPAIVAAKE